MNLIPCWDKKYIKESSTFPQTTNFRFQDQVFKINDTVHNSSDLMDFIYKMNVIYKVNFENVQFHERNKVFNNYKRFCNKEKE